MTVHPRTLAAAHPPISEWQLDKIIDNRENFSDTLFAVTCEVWRSRAILAPLHDAWLQAKPPCPTCGGTVAQNRASHDALMAGHSITRRLCPDCSDGVQPLDKWTAGLVALWVDWHDLTLSLTNVTEQHPRRFGGTR